jgi:hypothetical protein
MQHRFFRAAPSYTVLLAPAGRGMCWRVGVPYGKVVRDFLDRLVTRRRAARETC